MNALLSFIVLLTWFFTPLFSYGGLSEWKGMGLLLSSLFHSTRPAPQLPPPPPPFPWGDMGEEEFYKLKGVRNDRSFFHSPRGLSLFAQSWVPARHSPRALVFMVHGYGNDTSWTFQKTAILFTQMGYGSFAIDLQGHGRSDGLKGFIPDLDLVAHDCLCFFRSVKEKDEYQGLPCFLYGESMGGALCVLLHFMDREAWDGAILVAPMCKISDGMRPAWPIAEILKLLASWFPTWPIVPTKDLVDKSFKDPRKKELGRSNPRRYGGKPRLGTCAELLRITAYLGEHLQDVDFPFLVLHGDADVVTDPSVSKALYDNAKSQDKTFKLYKGMRHSLLQGEYDENVAVILSDISAWLGERVARKLKGGANNEADKMAKTNTIQCTDKDAKSYT